MHLHSRKILAAQAFFYSNCVGINLKGNNVEDYDKKNCVLIQLFPFNEFQFAEMLRCQGYQEEKLFSFLKKPH